MDRQHDADAARQPGIQRRSFIRNAGAALSATIAGSAAAATIVPPDARAQLQAHADAIRKLHYTLMERLNAAQFARIAELFADDAEVPLWSGQTYLLGHTQHRDEINIAPDRLCATGKFHCLARMETAISSPLHSVTEMARLQGGGVSQRWESGVFEIDFSRMSGRWLIRRLVYRPDTTASTPQPIVEEA